MLKSAKGAARTTGSGRKQLAPHSVLREFLSRPEGLGDGWAWLVAASARARNAHDPFLRISSSVVTARQSRAKEMMS